MENLGIDTKLLIAQSINFAIFFYLFKRFLAAPFGRFIDQEQKQEEAQQKAMEGARKQEELLVEKTRKLEDDMRKEAKKVIQEAKEAAQKVREQILEDARIEADSYKKRIQKQFEDERSALHKALEDKIVDLSFFVVKKSLGDVLNDETKKKVTSSILKNLHKKRLTS